MLADSEAHRASMSALADRYFEDQWRRLGPIKGVPGPRRRPEPIVAPALPATKAALRPKSRFARKPVGPKLEDFDPVIPRPWRE